MENRNLKMDAIVSPTSIFKFLWITLSFLMVSATSGTQNDDIIQWNPNYKLKWSDFKLKIADNSKEVAYVDGGIKFSLKQIGDSINIIVFAYCDRDKSAKTIETKWLIPEKLKHEQDHFDIWEWYARLFRKELKDAKNYTGRDQIMNMYHSIFKSANETENTYDLESNHSIDTVQQHKWDKLIVQKLQEYAAYSGTEIRMGVKKSR